MSNALRLGDHLLVTFKFTTSVRAEQSIQQNFLNVDRFNPSFNCFRVSRSNGLCKNDFFKTNSQEVAYSFQSWSQRAKVDYYTSILKVIPRWLGHQHFQSHKLIGFFFTLLCSRNCNWILRGLICQASSCHVDQYLHMEV